MASEPTHCDCGCRKRLPVVIHYHRHVGAFTQILCGAKGEAHIAPRHKWEGFVQEVPFAHGKAGVAATETTKALL